MLPSVPLDAAIADGVLAVLSMDAALASVAQRFHQTFPSSSASLHAAAYCQQLLQADDEPAATGAALASLRPVQRLSALWVLFSMCRAPLPAGHSWGSAASQSAWHADQLRRNPFLEALLQVLDGWNATSATESYRNVATAALTPAQRIERVFITRMLLPDEYLPAAPLQGLLQLSQLSAPAFADSSATIAQQLTFADPATLEAALVPLRAMVRENQPHPALLEALHSVSVPAAALQAEMRVPVSLLTAVLGGDFVSALRASEAASSRGATAAATAPSPSSETDASQLTLSVRALPPHFGPPPMLELDWGAPDWEELLRQADFGSMMPPELCWMNWDPPANMDWNAPLRAPGAASAVPMSPRTPSSSTPFTLALTKACKSQLLSGEKAQLLAELKACDPAGLSSAGAPMELPAALAIAMHVIPPSVLPQLVSKNHDVAIELLRQLMLLSQQRAAVLAAAPSPAAAAALSSGVSSLPHSVNDYLAPLVSMEMSLPCLEVAKALSVVEAPHTPLVLPPDFLHLYICKCIASCSRLQDKFLQHRYVRLLCAFLTTLIRKKVIQMAPSASGAAGASATPAPASADGASAPATASSFSSAASNAQSPSSASAAAAATAASVAAAADVRDVLLVEVASFLVEFASHKEAATLYKLIKSMENK